ncbi:MAG: rhodanese-like domain-containing protein [Sphingobacteriales bacterium]|nr:MAG: rhodanese-like domain-containing protein [Sphingobacteriales bacterium]TAF82216.1 MAG: rhodanese-like domain-containing protein [Sphingobacteriales bacterium]
MNLKKSCFVFFWLLPFAAIGQIKNPNFKALVDSLCTLVTPKVTIDSFKHIKNVYVLDTREIEEYEVSHLKNARNVGYIWFDMRNIYDIPKNATVVIYCSVGLRSQKICHKLISAGYQHVYNLYGSIFEWFNQGNPVYKSNGIQTSEIHTYTKDWAKWVIKGTKVY